VHGGIPRVGTGIEAQVALGAARGGEQSRLAGDRGGGLGDLLGHSRDVVARKGPVATGGDGACKQTQQDTSTTSHPVTSALTMAYPNLRKIGPESPSHCARHHPSHVMRAHPVFWDICALSGTAGDRWGVIGLQARHGGNQMFNRIRKR
jgi:hypothetical protein